MELKLRSRNRTFLFGIKALIPKKKLRFSKRRFDSRKDVLIPRKPFQRISDSSLQFPKQNFDPGSKDSVFN